MLWWSLYSHYLLTNDQRELLDSCVKGDLGAVIMKTLDSPDTPLVFGLTPLMVASSCGHVDIVDALIQAGADVNKEESHWGSLLCSLQ